MLSAQKCTAHSTAPDLWWLVHKTSGASTQHRYTQIVALNSAHSQTDIHVHCIHMYLSHRQLATSHQRYTHTHLKYLIHICTCTCTMLWLQQSSQSQLYWSNNLNKWITMQSHMLCLTDHVSFTKLLNQPMYSSAAYLSSVLYTNKQ